MWATVLICIFMISLLFQQWNISCCCPCIRNRFCALSKVDKRPENSTRPYLKVLETNQPLQNMLPFQVIIYSQHKLLHFWIVNKLPAILHSFLIFVRCDTFTWPPHSDCFSSYVWNNATYFKMWHSLNFYLMYNDNDFISHIMLWNCAGKTNTSGLSNNITKLSIFL